MRLPGGGAAKPAGRRLGPVPLLCPVVDGGRHVVACAGLPADRGGADKDKSAINGNRNSVDGLDTGARRWWLRGVGARASVGAARPPPARPPTHPLTLASSHGRAMALPLERRNLVSSCLVLSCLVDAMPADASLRRSSLHPPEIRLVRAACRLRQLQPGSSGAHVFWWPCGCPGRCL